ncbi:MAG: DUF3135 domain-containing protein [Pseudomonadota bacterium]
MKKKSFSKFDFDSMVAIAQNNPDEFERLRQQAIDEFIESASPENQARLRRLQWRIDQERRNRNPMSACIRISKMMWDHLLGSHGLLAHQERLLYNKHPVARDSAKVLRFTANANTPSR